MKKIFLSAGLVMALGAMTSCNEDFSDWADPQSYAQEDAIGGAASAFTAVTPSISLATVGDTVAIGHFTDVANVKNAVASKLTIGGAEVESFTSNNTVYVLKKDLREALVAETGALRCKNFDDSITVVAYGTTDQGAALRINTQPLHITFTNEMDDLPAIEEAYYLVGDMNGWSLPSAVQMTANGDSTFTWEGTVNDACWWKIAPASANAASDWDHLLGNAVDGATDMTSIAAFYQGEQAKSMKIEKGGKYKITYDAYKMVYTIENANFKFYLVGGFGQGWNGDAATGKTCMLYPITANKQTYTTKWTGAWDLKFWADADFGTWDACYGCAKDGDNAESGALINSGAQAISAPSADYYTFTIDLNDNTYTWTKLTAEPTVYQSISLIGDFNTWTGDVDLTKITEGNWMGTVTIETEGGIKFRADHDWAVNWGADVKIAEQYYATGEKNGANINIQPGTYTVYFNDITGQFAFIAK